MTVRVASLATGIRRLHAQGLTDVEIAFQLKCGKSTIWRARRDLGLKANKRKETYNKQLERASRQGKYRCRQFLTDEEIAQLYAGRGYG